MVIGKGSPDKILNESEIYNICSEAFESSKLDGKRILAVIPDHTRTAPIDVLFRNVYKLLIDKVKKLDFIIALGTHPPLSEKAIFNRVGINEAEYKSKYSKAQFFNHQWKDKKQLASIGTISKSEIEYISNGLMSTEVNVTINRIIFDYDVILIIGPTFPHEVVGFSGGNKYLFPGIAGQEIIDIFHWLGALITNPVINGKKDTPVRRVIDKAVSLLDIDRLCLSLVVKGKTLAGLFYGTPEAAFFKAADLSEKIHIIYKEKPFKKVLSCAPEMYDDIWTAGKCMYKLEPVAADGGELIIYAPHITEVSAAHGKVISSIGYHVRDYFVNQIEKFRDIPGGVMAHSTHVKGIGKYENGFEQPRVNVVLATGIPQEICKKINLGYIDPDSINLNDWKNREDEGILFVPKAGEILYRLYNKELHE
ncbi:lactate racemase domain-containing protein [candidate division KSB1 bacterium]